MKKQISITMEYDKFHYFSQNRTVAKSAVKRIAESIREIGYITSFPILVDKEFNIIDGQHRFEACKMLKIPVHYIIASKNGKELDSNKLMLNLNAKARGAWQMNEYTKHFAMTGKSKFHKFLADFDERFKFGANVSFNICLGHSGGSSERQNYRMGKDFPVWKHADACGVFIEKLKEVYPYALTSNFVRAIVQSYGKLTNAQREKLYRKVSSLPQQASTASYLACFENIINKGIHGEEGKVSLTNIR